MRSPCPTVAVVMGSHSDWETMQHACQLLNQFSVNYHTQVISAHRTPDLLFTFAEQAEHNGLHVIIAGAGGSAHLPGMIASKTALPVLGVPIQSHALNGMDSLLSIVQMPAGVAVGTLAIGSAGAKNAALLAIQILSLHNSELRDRLHEFRQQQTQAVLSQPLKELA